MLRLQTDLNAARTKVLNSGAGPHYSKGRTSLCPVQVLKTDKKLKK